MKSYTQARSGQWYETNLITGATTTGSVANAFVDSFQVIGFGPNLGRKFIDPVPGEYKKTYKSSLKGLTSRRQYSWFNDRPLVPFSYIKTGVETNYGVIFNSQFPLYYDTTTYNNALSNFYDGLRNSELNLALILAEGRESARTLQMGRSIYEILIAARRARRLAARNPSLLFSQLWLSWKYGWEPIIKDVYGSLAWLYRAFDDGVPVRGRAVRYEHPNTREVVNSFPQRTIRISGKRVWKAEIKCWVGLSNSDVYNLSRISSLNPVSIAWELVPLSFVCDWFLDVGGYLQNMEAALGAGVSFKRGYLTEVMVSDLKGSISFHGSGTSGYTNVVVDGFLENRDYAAWKRRQKLTGFPFPRLPRLEARLGWQRIVSLAALLRTVIIGGLADDQTLPKRPRRGRGPRFRWDDHPSRTR